MDNLLLNINKVLNCRTRRPNDPVDHNKIEEIVREARELKLHLEQYPKACTPEGHNLCKQLLEVYGT